MITATSINSVEDFQLYLSLLPTNDVLFNVDEAVKTCDKIGIYRDGKPCGILLCVLSMVGGKRVFFISALAVSTEIDGGDVYKWIENKAREMDCDYIVFDSPRKGMLFNARRFGWDITNVRYTKAL